MRFRGSLALVLFVALFATPVFAIERWLLITGAVGVFHTDARLFNPSFDKDIQLTAAFYSTAGGSPQTTTVTIPKRQMLVLDDVTARLFNVTNGLGAIQFTSNDTFEASSRIYAQAADGTLGQFAVGMPTGGAKLKGALLQLKQNGGAGQRGTFRTNIGLVNPNNSTANVTFVLYDKNNAIISNKTVAFAPLAVQAPTLMTSGVFFDPKTADLSDAWVSYSSDQPVLVYASVVDNGTTDPTFIPAVDDVGTPPTQPEPGSVSFEVTLQDFVINVTPAPASLKVGDKVTMHIVNRGGLHGFELIGPNGEDLVPNIGTIPVGSTGITRTFTVPARGTYFYFCTQPSCGIGHGNMGGDFTVGTATNDDPGRGY